LGKCGLRAELLCMETRSVRAEIHGTDRPLRKQLPKPKDVLTVPTFPLKSQFAYNDLAIGPF